jgi:hypothetical protein
MRTSIATLTVASLVLILATSAAHAAPTEVNVRIEGESETLFEGPIMTEGHDVQSASGTKEDMQEHPCDGTNNKAHATPGPTPTAAAVDAMSIIGETFSGEWYPGFDDYFVTRWGPDKEQAGMSWGLIVNNVFTDVGGCQYELDAGDEALWVYNAFSSRPLLALLPASAGYNSGARPLTATAELNTPFPLEVVAYGDKKEDEPPSTPERTGSMPYAGADVSPVKTSANGFENTEATSPQTVTTNAEGKASITFTAPGWHRIKAAAFKKVIEGGMEREVEAAIRSNRLDVCVPANGQSGCGEPPAEDRVRAPARSESEIKREEEAKHEEEVVQQEEAATRHKEEVEREEEIKREEEAKRREQEGKSEVLAFKAPGGGQSPGAIAGAVNVQTPILDGDGTAKGLVGVSWRILEAGVGLRSWTIAAKTIGAGGSAYVTRATGTQATTALLALPPGALYALQITFTDLLGRNSTMQIGDVLVPRDDRWSGLHYRGRWRRLHQAGAWLNTVSRGGSGTQVSATLGVGRPVFLLRGMRAAAKVEVRAGSHREVFTVTRGSNGSARSVVGPDGSRAGTVVLRVLEGTIDLDGVATEP